MSKNFWHDIETGTDVPEIINAIVEIPKGSMNKYEYDKKNNLINSINTSIVYSFKSFIPIIISSLFILKGAEYTMYFAGILVYSIAIIYTILNSKKINLITKSHINRYHGKSYQKKNFIILNSQLNYFVRIKNLFL